MIWCLKTKVDISYRLLKRKNGGFDVMKLMDLFECNPIFSCLDSITKAYLQKQAITRNYSENQWVTHYGDVWPYLFIVGEGAITAMKESLEGRSLIVARFEKGEIFWGLGFFLEEAPTPAALIASEKSNIHLWSRDLLLPILLENGQMAWEISTLMVNRMLLASDIVEGLAFQPVISRLAQYLIEHFGKDEGEKISRDVTLDEMAAYIGSTREMVCRMLQKLSGHGLIEITRTDFTFTNREGLRELAVTTKVQGNK
jgi:CRP-like cAMP-binding protein